MTKSLLLVTGVLGLVLGAADVSAHSAHQLHLAHLRHLRQSANSTTAHSAHERHLRHLQQSRTPDVGPSISIISTSGVGGLSTTSIFTNTVPFSNFTTVVPLGTSVGGATSFVNTSFTGINSGVNPFTTIGTSMMPFIP